MPSSVPRPSAYLRNIIFGNFYYDTLDVLRWFRSHSLYRRDKIVLVGQKDDPQTSAMLKSLYERFIPNKVVLLRSLSDEAARDIIALVPFVENQQALGGRTTAYVCKNYHCEFPTNDIRQFEQLLDQ